MKTQKSHVQSSSSFIPEKRTFGLSIQTGSIAKVLKNAIKYPTKHVTVSTFQELWTIVFNAGQISRRPSDQSSSHFKNHIFWVNMLFLWRKTEYQKTRNFRCYIFGEVSLNFHFKSFGPAVLVRLWLRSHPNVPVFVPIKIRKKTLPSQAICERQPFPASDTSPPKNRRVYCYYKGKNESRDSTQSAAGATLCEKQKKRAFGGNRHVRAAWIAGICGFVCLSSDKEFLPEPNNSLKLFLRSDSKWFFASWYLRNLDSNFLFWIQGKKSTRPMMKGRPKKAKSSRGKNPKVNSVRFRDGNG